MSKIIRINYHLLGSLESTIVSLFIMTWCFGLLQNHTKFIILTYYLVLCAFIVLRFILRLISPTALIAYHNGIYSTSYGFISWENIEHISLQKQTTRHRRGFLKGVQRYITIKIKNDRLIQPKTIIQKIRSLFLSSGAIKISPLDMDVEKTAFALRSITCSKRKTLQAIRWDVSDNKIDIILESRRKGSLILGEIRGFFVSGYF